MKKSIFARGARITSAKREVLSAGVQGPLKGPGSTRVLGALWGNLSLIFEHVLFKNSVQVFITYIMCVILTGAVKKKKKKKNFEKRIFAGKNVLPCFP